MLGVSPLGVLPLGIGPKPAATSSPVAFTGTVPGQSATVGVPFSLDVASYFSGSLTPFTYTLQSGTLPAGLTLSGSVISGTPTTAGTASGLVIRATDTSSNVADTNSFSIAVAAATNALFRNMPNGALSGLGSGGPFFQNPLQ